MGDEGARQSAAVERLQHGRLDLDEAALVEEAAHGRDDARPLDEHLLDLVVGDEVEVAAPIAGLHVGEPVELLGQRAQRLGEQLEGADAQRELAAPGAHHRAAEAGDVADVEVLQSRIAGLAERVAGGEQLQLAAAVLDHEEGDLAVQALGDEATGHAMLAGRLLTGLQTFVSVTQGGDLLTSREAGRERDGCGAAPLVELAAPLVEDVAPVLRLVHAAASTRAR